MEKLTIQKCWVQTNKQKARKAHFLKPRTKEGGNPARQKILGKKNHSTLAKQPRKNYPG
jgi:hypothetical protein